MSNLDTDLILSIDGMTCEGCVNSVRKVLSAVPGTEAVTVDLASGVATVRGHAERSALEAAVTRAGFDIVPAT